MTELSPAASVVRKAAHDVFDQAGTADQGIAAALRALAIHGEAVEIRTASGMAEFDEVIRTSDILAIAAELDGALHP